MSIRSLASAVVVILLAVVALDVPAAAAPRTWYVAPTGSGGGSCAHPDFHKIQSAIAAAGHDDTILVCDGTYVEVLTINGPGKDRLKVKAVHRGKAVVRPPAPGRFSDFISPLVWINNADNTVFSGFTLAARGTAPCLPVRGMILLGGSSTVTTIAHNRLIVAGGGSDYEAPCGYAVGIQADWTTATAFIDDNQIVDFGWSGIVMEGRNPRITNNRLTFAHLDSDVHYGYDGIALHGSTNAIVRGNDIVSPVTAGASTPLLPHGISFSKATGAIVSRNTVRHTYYGIAAESWVGGRIRRNTVRNSLRYGIVLKASKGVDVLENSSLGSGTFDCIQSGTAGTNSWTDNIGKTSNPAGLCSAP